MNFEGCTSGKISGAATLRVKRVVRVELYKPYSFAKYTTCFGRKLQRFSYRGFP